MRYDVLVSKINHKKSKYSGEERERNLKDLPKASPSSQKSFPDALKLWSSAAIKPIGFLRLKKQTNNNYNLSRSTEMQHIC